MAWLTTIDGPLVADTVRVHQAVVRATGGGGRVLWAAPRDGLLVVQSPAPVPDGALAGTTRSAPLPVSWDRGQTVRLSLIANPVVCRAQPGTARGKRATLPVDQHDSWLRRKLDAAVVLTDVAVQPIGCRHGRRRDGTVVTHFLSAFTALAVVEDPSALRALVLGGVGPGKAFGAGLLLVGAP